MACCHRYSKKTVEKVRLARNYVPPPLRPLRSLGSFFPIGVGNFFLLRHVCSYQGGISTPDVLPKHQPNKSWCGHKVASPHSARLTDKSIGPLKTDITDPLWSTRICSCIKVEDRSDRTDYWNVELPPVCFHPFFLFWRSHSYPEDVRLSLVDHSHHPLILHFTPGTKRWRHCSAQGQRWKINSESFGNKI